MEYFWYHRPEDDHPPPIVREPGELSGSDRVAIACTQTGWPSSRQKALVQEWIRVLPDLRGIRLLWLVSRVPQPLFEAACRVPGLVGLYVKWSGIKSADALHDADSLEHLHLGSSPGLESLRPLSKCLQLETLGLENLKRIHDLTPLAGLEGLEQLAVVGSTWTTQRVDSLAPLASLKNLRYLSIVNLRANDGTLKPLYALRRLERFEAAQWWDPQEVEELRRLNLSLVD